MLHMILEKLLETKMDSMATGIYLFILLDFHNVSYFRKICCLEYIGSWKVSFYVRMLDGRGSKLLQKSAKNQSSTEKIKMESVWHIYWSTKKK